MLLLLGQVLVLLSEEVVEKCVAVVRQLKGITATYRMTSKGPPVRHSHYVTGERPRLLLSRTMNARGWGCVAFLLCGASKLEAGW